VENNHSRNSNDNSNCNSSIAGAIKNLAQKYKTMHINSKDNKAHCLLNNNQIINYGDTQNTQNNNNLVQYNTIYQKTSRIDTNIHRIHNAKTNTSVVYNSDLITSINQKTNSSDPVTNTTNGNSIDTSIIKNNGDWADYLNVNVHKVVSSSSNLNDSNDMIIYQSKDHSSSPVLYPPTSLINSPLPMATTPTTTVSSQLTNAYLSPLFQNNNNNKTLLNKNNSCLHVPRLIKSPILQRVSSITLPSIDTNDNSMNSSAK
jgi:hypothetical protein